MLLLGSRSPEQPLALVLKLQGGLGGARTLFGMQLGPLGERLNYTLAA
jgi:hypothetical protein